MYLWTNSSETGYLASSQRSGGMYMIAFQCEDNCYEQKSKNGFYLNVLCCAVRHVVLRQLGHFMMGYFRWMNRSIIVSGGLGSDGLPKPYMIGDKPYGDWAAGIDDQYLLDHAVKMPEQIAVAYWNYDDGWNSVGRSSIPIRLWALYEPDLFTPQGKKRLLSFKASKMRQRSWQKWLEVQDEFPKQTKEFLEEWVKTQKEKLNI